MKVKGVTEKQILQTAKRVGVEVENLAPVGNYFNFTLRTPVGAPPDCKYRKRGHTGRRTYHICYHGHYAFMERLYTINPETIIRSTMAVYKNKADFERLAGKVAYAHVEYAPGLAGGGCDCQ